MDSERFHITFKKPLFIPLFFLLCFLCWMWLFFFLFFLAGANFYDKGNLLFILCYILFLLLGLIMVPYRVEIIDGDIVLYLLPFLPFVRFKISKERIKSVKVLPREYKRYIPFLWGCYLIVKIKRPFPYMLPVFLTAFEILKDDNIKKVIEYYNEGELQWKNSM